MIWPEHNVKEREDNHPWHDVTEHNPFECERPVLWAVEGVELHHEECAALTDRLDNDEKPEQRCHVTPADSEPVLPCEGGLDEDWRRIGGEVLDLPRVIHLEGPACFNNTGFCWSPHLRF